MLVASGSAYNICNRYRGVQSVLQQKGCGGMYYPCRAVGKGIRGTGEGTVKGVDWQEQGRQDTESPWPGYPERNRKSG